MSVPSNLFANQIDANKYQSLNAAVSANSGSDGTLVISSVLVVTGNISIPSNLSVAILHGGRINHANHSIAINGYFSAGLYRCFQGTGLITFGISATPDVYPQWWGAKGDGVTDDAVAFIKADNAVGDSGQVRVPSGTYYLSSASGSRSTWVLDSHSTITGPGSINTNHRVFKIGNGGLWGGGTKIGSTNNWLQTQLNAIAGRTSEDAAEFIVLSHSGNIGGVFGSRTSDNILSAGSEGTISQASFTINDNTAAPQTSYAIYGDAIRNRGAGTTHFFEGDIVNRGSVVDISPQSPFVTGATHNLWLASGGQVPDAQDASSAIGIVNNGAKFRKGIVFHQTALAGADGKAGLGEAISLGKGHFLQWYNAVGNSTSAIIGAVSSATRGTKIVFDDNGFNIVNTSGDKLLNIPSINQKKPNYIQLLPASSKTSVEIRAEGPDVNVGVDLKAKGNGVVGFYTASQLTSPKPGGASPLPATPAGYIRVKINGIERLIPYY